MSGQEERDPTVIEQRVKKYIKHNHKNTKIAGCANRSLQLLGSSWNDWVWMQIQTDILQIIPLATAPLRGAAAAAENPRGWAAGSEHRGAKLVASFLSKCLEHLFSNLCHKISRWEWKLLGPHFLPTSDQLSYATTWQNEVLNWKHLDWTKHQAMCLSWTGAYLGRSSTPLPFNEKSTFGIIFRAMEEPVSSEIRSDKSPVWPWVGLSFLCLDSLLTKWIVCCFCCAICSNQDLFPITSYPKSRRAESSTGLES